MHRRVPISVLFALGLLALLAAPVAAHAELVSANPAQGGTISGAAPVTLVATYSEAMAPDRSSMQLIDASGATIASGGVDTSDTSGTTMKISVPAGLPKGLYEVRWTTVTADDNGVLRGTYQFSVDPAATGSRGGSDVPATPPPSAAPGSGSGSGSSSGDVTLPVIVVIVAVVVLIAFFTWRNRRRSSTGTGSAGGSGT